MCVLGCREAGKMVCATLLSGLQGLQVHWPLLCLVIFRSLQLGFSCPLLLYPTTLYTPTWKLVLGCSRAGTGWRGPARPVCHIFRDLLQPCKFFFGIQIVLVCSVHKDKHAQVRKTPPALERGKQEVPRPDSRSRNGSCGGRSVLSINCPVFIDCVPYMMKGAFLASASGVGGH